MKQTVYIAGPMQGKPDYNRAAFNAAAKHVAEELGAHPINPVDIERTYPCVGEDGEIDERALVRLLEIECEFIARADAIYLLRGWEYSKGARLELLAYLEAHEPENQVILVQGCNCKKATEGGV